MNFFSSVPKYDPKNRESSIKRPIEEKRKLYKCKSNYVTLERIKTWPDYYKSLNNTTKLSSDLEIASKVSIWCGDITKLEIDAIVNAANSSLLGVYYDQ